MRFVLFLISTFAIAGEFSTSLGDSYPYMISAITTDPAGNTYVVGSRALGGPGAIFGGVASVVIFPIISFQNFLASGSDIFVSKLDPNGRLLFTDTFAGKGIDTGKAIAVDATGNIYVGGTTTSPDFPLSKALQTQPNPNNGTGFVIKLSNDGSTILYSTYFGGTLGSTSITALATDSQGNLYLTGSTMATDFPHTPGMPFTVPIGNSNSGVILASISAGGDRILYAGAIVAGPIPVSGGTTSTGGVGVAVDAAGNAYFAGNVGNQINALGSFTGIVAKINPAGTSLTNLTYLSTFVSAIASDAAGDAYIAGFNYGLPNGPVHASIAKLNPSGAVVWTNNLGGQASSTKSIAVDAAGNVWANGGASSPSFPNANGWSSGPEYLVGLNNGGTAFTYSALFPAGTVAQSIALDPSGTVHVAGMNGFVSAIAPTTAPTTKIFGFQNAFGGLLTARISPAEVISIYGPGIGPASAVNATPNLVYPKTLGGVQVTINGQNMPLLYVSATQINAVTPMGIAPGAAATVRVINGSTVSPDYPVWTVAAAAQSFPTVLNQDGTINSQSNPAKAGTVVTFYATGWQSIFPSLADGQVAGTGAVQDVCNGNCVGTTNFTILYAGAAPGIVAGVTQFNIRVNAGTSSGVSQVVLELIAPASLTQTVWVAP